MTSGPRGNSTSRAEVTHISEPGLWVMVAGRELFLSFANFPWFRDATVAAVLNVEVAGPEHLRWPDLDVDLALESIEYPERFPLVSGARSNGSPRAPASTAQRKRVARKRQARKRPARHE